MDTLFHKSIYRQLYSPEKHYLIQTPCSDNWKSFAQDNLGARTLFPENIIGSSLWDHIRDPETQHLYEIILQKVRERNRQPNPL